MRVIKFDNGFQDKTEQSISEGRENIFEVEDTKLSSLFLTTIIADCTLCMSSLANKG